MAPISTATEAAAARAVALRENSGFDVYERVAPLGRVMVRMHRFSVGVNDKMDGGGGTRLTFFPFFFNDFVAEGVDAAERLRAYLVKNEYRRGYWRGFALAVFVFDGWRRRNWHVMVERVGEKVLLRGRFLVRVAEEILKGERPQSEEVGIDDLEVALRWR